MKKYTLKRILTSLFTLLAILLVLFILMQLMPGSPFNDEKLTPDMRAALYAKYGLDQPIYIQFFRYVGNMLRGDLGVSYNISKNTPISQLIQSRLPISIQVKIIILVQFKCLISCCVNINIAKQKSCCKRKRQCSKD